MSPTAPCLPVLAVALLAAAFAAPLVASFAAASEEPAEPAPEAEVGSHAPTFSLRDQDDGSVNSAELRGRRNLLLAFYPRDFTPG